MTVILCFMLVGLIGLIGVNYNMGSGPATLFRVSVS